MESLFHNLIFYGLIGVMIMLEKMRVIYDPVAEVFVSMLHLERMRSDNLMIKFTDKVHEAITYYDDSIVSPIGAFMYTCYRLDEVKEWQAVAVTVDGDDGKILRINWFDSFPLKDAWNEVKYER